MQEKIGRQVDMECRERKVGRDRKADRDRKL